MMTVPTISVAILHQRVGAERAAHFATVLAAASQKEGRKKDQPFWWPLSGATFMSASLDTVRLFVSVQLVSRNSLSGRTDLSGARGS